MSSTASAVAKYIIKEFQDSGEPITNLKVQKLLYYVQGWHLGLYGVPAFEEDLEAWVHGPVEYGVFQEYQEFSGGSPITKIPTKPKFKTNLEKHIHEVLQEYSGENALALEVRTHKEWPWMEARKDLKPNEWSRNKISKQTMQDFFKEYYERNKRTGNYILNNETIKSVEESKRGIGVKSFSSVKEMFDDVYDDLKAEGFIIPNYDRT
jgi:uncharacterized phage-associated protein